MSRSAKMTRAHGINEHNEEKALLFIQKNEWFGMGRFCFTSTTVCGMCVALIIMKINDLNVLGFNGVRLNLFSYHVKSFNQADNFE